MASDETKAERREWLEEWIPAMARVAASYATREERDDLLQEILLALWQSREGFRGESSLRTYVYRVAHNRAIDYVRKRSRRPDSEPVTEVVSASPGPEREAQARCERRRLVAAVRALPLTYQQPLTMSLDGLRHAEIAEVLGISESNVAVRIQRARKRLKEALDA